MNKGIELCGIKLGDTFDENKFKIKKKQSIPEGDYMYELANAPSSPSTFFNDVSIIHPLGSKKISGVIATNGDGYSREYAANFINQVHNYYCEKYGDYYDMYVSENDKTLFYLYYFYPPNYNVISFQDPKSSELKEPVTTLMLLCTEGQFKEFNTIEAMLMYYEDVDDDKSPEELDNTQEKTFLKVAGLRL